MAFPCQPLECNVLRTVAFWCGVVFGFLLLRSTGIAKVLREKALSRVILNGCFMLGKEFLGKKVCVCVTCDWWAGELREPTDDRKGVEYESFQRGVCLAPKKTGPTTLAGEVNVRWVHSGTMKSGQSTTPLNKCRAWRLWKVMNRPRTKVDNDYVAANPFMVRNAQ